MYLEQEREKDKKIFEMKEQELMDRIRTIWKNNWFTGIEIGEIRKEVLAVDGDASDVGNVEDQMSESQTVELHVEENP